MRAFRTAPTRTGAGPLRCGNCAAQRPAAGGPDCPWHLPDATANPTARAVTDAAPAFHVNHVRRAGGHALVRVTGELDLHTACDLHFQLRSLLTDTPRIAMDLSGLAFTDAAGIRALLQAAQAAQAVGGWLRLVDVGPRVHRVVEILRLDRALALYASEYDALHERERIYFTASRSSAVPAR
ncbi:MAG TPA: STAS domain-containing protein [Actinospica sp.]|jgi:anti-sigma B factor antagonist|nr:STAS domain-containing protein [Actinospica sp.]